MAQLQAQVDALISADEMAADAAAQLDEAVQALEVRAAWLEAAAPMLRGSWVARVVHSKLAAAPIAMHSTWCMPVLWMPPAWHPRSCFACCPGQGCRLLLPWAIF